MRTTTADEYGLTVPAGVVFAFGEKVHRYTTGDDFSITVTDKGADTVEIDVFSPEGILMETNLDVAKTDVKDIVKGHFGKYRF